MALTLQTLRTTSERVWLTLAIVFSVCIWLAIASAYGLLFFHTPTIPAICYYEDYDYDSEEYYMTYRVLDIHDDESDVDDCIPENEVDNSIVVKAQSEALYEAKSAKLGGIFAGLLPLVYLGLFFMFLYITTALSMAYIRLNGMRLSKTQYPELYESYMQAAEKLGIQDVPAAYVIDADGAANAFAIKIAHKRMVVFFAELVDRMLSEKKMNELQAIAAHELTHVKLGHIYYWFALLPFSMLPFMGNTLSRAREYSADRGALFVTNSKSATITALVKLVLGTRLARIVDRTEYIESSMNERGLFVTLLRLTTTHPTIPERMVALEHVEHSKV